MNTLGICIGASSVGLVELRGEDGRLVVARETALAHDGRPLEVLTEQLTPDLLARTARLAVTGRKLKHRLRAATLPEAEALETAYQFQRGRFPGVQAVVSAGGETCLVYRLDANGRIADVLSGNKCASGTGEFFLQQLRRLGLGIEEAMAAGEDAAPYRLASRCSVFCKSDCTHALNKGVPKGEVVAGLCRMMAGKILELLHQVPAGPVLLVGGSARNRLQLKYLQEKLPDLSVPPQAAVYEALGAAMWAREHGSPPPAAAVEFFQAGDCSFSFHPPLRDSLPLVTFKELTRGSAEAGEHCVLGLDVGSTTTKAVLLRRADNTLLADCYLRTNGDPVGAARRCYRELLERLPAEPIIEGLGVTGSGRQIAALHALSPGVVNEIIAHAEAAVWFDPEVDTIFEIGGQDAKYTFLCNGVAVDYSMNEACSAGTGSFLEEAAGEYLDIPFTEIGDVALRLGRPPNFSDQCAAFIGSDVKSAIQEGLGVGDITAGLVYSVCLNYIRRVKGNRRVGGKVFMQGGVCYNHAVPAAMAALIGKPIVVPPEPGLMGAFGAALHVREKLQRGLLTPRRFSLSELADREVVYHEPFTCRGGREKCRAACRINRLEIAGRVFHFGGACSRYTGLLREEKIHPAVDLVARRETLLREEPARPPAEPDGPTIGINGSLLTHALLPLYTTFFRVLGCRVVTAETSDPSGMERKGAAFCHPVETAHGTMADLLSRHTDFIFLPHVRALPLPPGATTASICPLVQGEPYYLRTAFPELRQRLLLQPVLDFSRGFTGPRQAFLDMARRLGVHSRRAMRALRAAAAAQEAFLQECRRLGREILDELVAHPQDFAVVVFGRPYNAMTRRGNLNIPQKIATQGVRVVPCDFLPWSDEPAAAKMYWAFGQTVLQAARVTARHPQLFGVFVTSFSCGPDSFIINYFRQEMGTKPSLILELDGHTADAGVDTRIEAFLEVVRSYRQLHRPAADGAAAFCPAEVRPGRGGAVFRDSRGRERPLDHPSVRLLIPSMGGVGTRLLAAAFRRNGVGAEALPEPTETEFKLGLGHTSCKECLPFQLTFGSLLSYLQRRPVNGDGLLFFMPHTCGPCRFGQYHVLMESLVRRLRLENVALFSVSDRNSFRGLGARFQLRAWQAVLLSDILDDIRCAMLVLAADPPSALELLGRLEDDIEHGLVHDDARRLLRRLRAAAAALAAVPRRRELGDTPQVALVGEIYVRSDAFSRQNLPQRLAEKGIVVRKAPVQEWINYLDFIARKRYIDRRGRGERMAVLMRNYLRNRSERIIKGIFHGCGFYEMHLCDIEGTVAAAEELISPRLTGEAVLTIGAAMNEIIDQVAGVIAIGPFGCMPGRIAEAIIRGALPEHKRRVTQSPRLVEEVLHHHPALPFLALETDGNLFPLMTEARLEAFCLKVDRVHRRIRAWTAGEPR